MKPGEEENFNTEFIDLMKTYESIEADHTEITCDYSVIEEEPCLESDTNCSTDEYPDEMAEKMIITRCVFRGSFGCIDCLSGNKTDGYQDGRCVGNVLETNSNWEIEDKNEDGKISFYELKEQEIDNLPAVTNNVNPEFGMSVKFNESAGNNLQGDTFNLKMKFTLNQDANQ